MFKKVPLLVLTAFLGLGVVSCSGDQGESEYVPSYSEPTYDPYTGEDDSKFVVELATSIISSIASKLVDSAKSTANKIVNKGVSYVQNKVETWLQKNIFDTLGISIFKAEKGYSINDVMDGIESIKDSLSKIQESIDVLKDEVNYTQYKNQFNDFTGKFTNAINNYSAAFQGLVDANNVVVENVDDKENKLDKYTKADESVRGSIQITQTTPLHTTALDMSSLILGSKGASETLTVPSVFEIVRKLVEHDVPFDAKRKFYEDSYLPFIVANFQSLCALDQFDLTYNMEKYGIEDIVTADADGQVLGFTFNGQNYYFWDKSTFTEDVKTKYATELAKLTDYIVPTLSAVPEYNAVIYLFRYYSQIEQAKINILNLYNSYVRNLDSTYYNLSTSNFNRKLAITPKVIHFSDFVINNYDTSGHLGTDRAYNCNINFDAFDYIDRKTFTSFVNAIKGSAGDKTFYEYFKFIGFNFPRDSSAPANYQCLLPIGVKKYDNVESYNSNRNMEVTHAAIAYINLDMRVKDYKESDSFNFVYVYHLKYRSGNCNEKWHFTRNGYYIGVKSGSRYTNKINGSSKDYLDLNLISWPGLVGDKKVKTGTVNFNNLSTDY